MNTGGTLKAARSRSHSFQACFEVAVTLFGIFSGVKVWDRLPRGGWDGELVPVRVELCRTTHGLGCSYRGSGGVVFRGVGKAVGPVWVEA